MHLCYIDESGTPEVPGTSTHFVLAGLSLPVWHWRTADSSVSAVLSKYGLEHAELHTAWLLRPYLEQKRIPDFEALPPPLRRSAVERERAAHLLRLQKTQNAKAIRQAKKNYRHTAAYTHLTHDQRVQLVREVADRVAGWGFARLFAELVDKTYFDSAKTKRSISEQALEQVVSRFDYYLTHTGSAPDGQNYGLLVHDNNQTVALKHTQLVREFHQSGTLWRDVTNIVDTPLFVESSLTRMVQIADLCAYALRRYIENDESDLFDRIYERADRAKAGNVVGIRHFSNLACKCKICTTHRGA